MCLSTSPAQHQVATNLSPVADAQHTLRNRTPALVMAPATVDAGETGELDTLPLWLA
jgi:hypothetical protein